MKKVVFTSRLYQDKMQSKQTWIFSFKSIDSLLSIQGMFQRKFFGFSKTTIFKYISSNRQKISNFKGKHLI